MNQLFEKKYFRKDDLVYAKLCSDLTVYWNGSIFERAEGIIHFYHRFFASEGVHIKYYKTDLMDSFRQIDTDILKLLPHWLEEKDEKRDIFSIEFRDNKRPEDLPDHSFVLMADEEGKVGYLRILMPVEFALQSAEAFVDLVRELVEKLNFTSGHAGCSLAWDPDGDMDIEVREKMEELSSQFPEIDLPDPETTLIDMIRIGKPSIKCISWLTLINTKLCDHIGGVESVKKNLIGCEISELSQSIIIRAGKMPFTGQGSGDLGAYHGVGKLLAPLRIKNHSMIFGSPEATNKWLGRFD